jgi:hypothetical protein
MRKTSARVHWHGALSSAPPGLSIRELAQRLGEAYPTVSFWAKTFGYPYKSVPRGRKTSIDWDRVDWDRRNSDLARELGVTGERVRQMRAELRLPPAPRVSEGGMRFRQFVHENGPRLKDWSIREMISLSGASISTATAHVILQQFKKRDGQILGPTKRAKKKRK